MRLSMIVIVAALAAFLGAAATPAGEEASAIGQKWLGLLDDQKYSDAVQLATDRIGRDPSEQSNLIPISVNKAEELMISPNAKDLTGAQQLIDLASKIPKLDPIYQGRLSDTAAEIHKRMSNTPGQ